MLIEAERYVGTSKKESQIEHFKFSTLINQASSFQRETLRSLYKKNKGSVFSSETSMKKKLVNRKIE